VPVLSNATTRTWRIVSSAWASRTRMPRWAARPVPTIRAVGVARPSAHGQAITSTDTACTSAASQSPAARPQPSRVTAASASTAGTNTSATRSTVFWIAGLRACASSTMRTMRASRVSVPTAVTRSTTRPSPLMAPPVTASPGSRATGRLSPVSSDSSKWLRPSISVPSVGTRSPGRTTTSSPTASVSTGTLTRAPPRRTVAVGGASARRASSAARVRRRARASSHLPSSTSDTTTAALSK
jgi:hypothetical protein